MKKKIKKLKLKIIYDEFNLKKKIKKEIMLNRQKIKIKKKEIRERRRKMRRKKCIGTQRAVYRIKDIDIQHYNKKIEWLKEVEPEEYIKYFDKECIKMENEQESTTDETIINNILNKRNNIE